MAGSFMEIEPFELNGKTIKEAYHEKISEAKQRLIIEFTDHTKYAVSVFYVEDEITGHPVPLNEVVVTKELL